MSTSANTGWLKNNNGDKFAPKTLTSQVINSDGISIEQTISQLNNEKVDKTELTLGIKDNKIYLFVGGIAVGNGVEQSVDQNGDVVGYIDANNNIVLTGIVPEGVTYNVKYEMEDGTTIDIGELSLVEVEQPNIPDTPTQIINQIPISIDANGNPFNGGQGWKTGYRLSGSGGGESSSADIEVTGFIPVKFGDTLYFRGITDSGSHVIGLYKSDFTFIGGQAISTLDLTLDGSVVSWTIDTTFSSSSTVDETSTAYIRISADVIDNNSVITINQEITEDSVVDTPNSDDDSVAEKFVNQIPLSVGTNGNLFIGTNGEAGYKTGYRISGSSGEESAQTGTEVTGFIPIKWDDSVYMKNIADDSSHVIAMYSSNFEYLSGFNFQAVFSGAVNGELAKFTLNGGNVSWGGTDGSKKDLIAYMRVSATEITADSIITINQPIE